MSVYEKWKDRYDRNWATKEQLQRLVELGVLSQEEYTRIVTSKDDISQ